MHFDGIPDKGIQLSHMNRNIKLVERLKSKSPVLLGPSLTEAKALRTNETFLEYSHRPRALRETFFKSVLLGYSLGSVKDEIGRSPDLWNDGQYLIKELEMARLLTGLSKRKLRR